MSDAQSEEGAEQSEADVRPPRGGWYTQQLMKGGVIVAVALSLGKAIGPYYSQLPQQTAEYLSLALLILVSYGVYLVVTSPLCIAGLEGLQQAFGGEDRAE